MTLSRQEYDEALILREQFLAIFEEWSKNPSDFEYNINALVKLEVIISKTLQMMMQHMPESNPKVGKLFDETSSKQLILKANKIGNQIKDLIVADESVQKAFKQFFSHEPRIISLNVNKKFNRKEEYDVTKGAVSNYSESETTQYVYIIEFSDHSKIELNSLNDKEKLLGARTLFENKMHELSSERRMKMH